MTNDQLNVYARVCAVNARIAAMQAENTHSMNTTHSIKYGEDAFLLAEFELLNLANEAVNCYQG